MQAAVENGNDSMKIKFRDGMQAVDIIPVKSQFLARDRLMLEYISL